MYLLLVCVFCVVMAISAHLKWGSPFAQQEKTEISVISTQEISKH